MIHGNDNRIIFTNETHLYNMKKIIYFVFAALVLVACEPNNGATEKVRIGVSLDDNTQPAKGPQRISAIDGATEIEIKWEEGDVLYYQLDGEGINTTNPFKLISGAGSRFAYFEHDAFVGMEKSFTLYYHGFGNPLDEKDPTYPNFSEPMLPINQVISINSITGTSQINNDYLMYKATNCEVGKAINLEPQFTILGVQLFGTYTEFDECVTIGSSSEWGENGTAYQCQPLTNMDLTNEPIYYIVLPLDYDLSDKELRLANQRGHHTSNQKLSLSSIKLNPMEAQIIGVDIANYNNSNGDAAKYDIAKHRYNQ